MYARPFSLCGKLLRIWVFCGRWVPGSIFQQFGSDCPSSPVLRMMFRNPAEFVGQLTDGNPAKCDTFIVQTL